MSHWRTFPVILTIMEVNVVETFIILRFHRHHKLYKNIKNISLYTCNNLINPKPSKHTNQAITVF
jgi:hypothetical protein